MVIDIENPESVIYRIEENCLGNLDVSLYWEEKVVLLLRYTQFYGFLLLIFFEDWPEAYRWQSPYMFFFGGQWNLVYKGQEAWYEMITDADVIFWTFVANYGVLLSSVIFGICIFTCKNLNYKLVMYSQKWNVFKTYMWIIELI